MEQTKNTLGVVNLTEEIQHHRRLTEAFEGFLAGLKTSGGLSVESEADLDSLTLLLAEVIDQRKILEKQEKELKSEVRRHFPKGFEFLDLPSVVALVNARERTDLDRDAIKKDFGQAFFDKYGKKTSYEVMTVKRKTS